MMKEICIVLLFILMLPAAVSSPSAEADQAASLSSAISSAQKIDNNPYEAVISSPDSTRIVTLEQSGAGGRYVISGPDGKVGGQFYKSVQDFVFSPNGEHYGYKALAGDKWAMVVDGIEGEKYDVEMNNIIFAQNGSRYAYLAPKDDKWVMVVDGREEGPYEGSKNDPIVSSAGQHVLYTVHTDRDRVVLDGQIQDPGGYSPVVSPDGSRWAYSYGGAYAGDPTYIILDGGTIDLDKSNMVRQKVFSPDGKRFAYSWGTGDAYASIRVVVDGAEGNAYPFPGVGKIVFSPDGSHVAYSAKSKGDGFMMVLDGQEGYAYNEITDPVFSQDGSHIAYIAKDKDGKFVVLDGVEAKRYSNVWGLNFSTSGRLGFVAQDELGQMVVLDGQEELHYISDGYGHGIRYGPVFSPDGKHAVYVANDGGKDEFVVIDGVQHSHPGPMRYMGGLNWGEGSHIVFDSDDGFHYLAVNETGTYLVRVNIPSSEAAKAGGSEGTESSDVGPAVDSQPGIKSFEFNGWGSYKFINTSGKRYFAAYTAEADQPTPYLWQRSEDRDLKRYGLMSEVLTDDRKERTFTSSTPLRLEEGYELAIRSIDAEGSRLYLELSKNGQAVDSGVIQPFPGFESVDDRTYCYRSDIGQAKRMVLMAVYFKNAFKGSDMHIAVVGGVFQISDSPSTFVA